MGPLLNSLVHLCSYLIEYKNYEKDFRPFHFVCFYFLDFFGG